jgi:hypothetical protein
MFCHRCGASVGSEVRFCPSCGQALPGAAPAVGGVPRPFGRIEASPGRWISEDGTWLSGSGQLRLIALLFFCSAACPSSRALIAGFIFDQEVMP